MGSAYTGNGREGASWRGGMWDSAYSQNPNRAFIVRSRDGYNLQFDCVNVKKSRGRS
jgi:hypothetical protein